MPIYEYRCRDCDHQFEAIVQGKKRPSCPHCEGKRLSKEFSVFAVGGGGGGKSEVPEACRSCPNSSGPGACGIN